MTQEEKVSLSEVFSHVFVSPAEAAHMLQAWAQQHSGGGQPELTAKLNQAAADIANPQTKEQPQQPQMAAPGSQQAPDVVYANPQDQNTQPADTNRPLEPPLAPPIAPDQNR